MPKSEDCKRVTVSNWITALANNSITAHGEDVYCKMCDKQIANETTPRYRCAQEKCYTAW